MIKHTSAPLRFEMGKGRARIALYPWVRVAEAKTRENASVLARGELPFMLYGEEDPLAKRAVLSAFSIFPAEARREIERVVLSRGRTLSELEEIRLSRYATSSVTLMGRELAISLTLSGEMLSSIVKGICHGAPFAHREEMAEGYLPFDEGMRVGVGGLCRYERGEESLAIREIHTLTFRIPHVPPSNVNAQRLYQSLRKHTHRGCLIVSAPRVGKTTVLRMLCRCFSEGETGVRVAVVDTRGEFSYGDSEGTFMDVLRGYPRRVGASIALRTLAPHVLAMDEIGGEGDAEALFDVMRAGVKILATAHAVDREDIYHRPRLLRIVESGVFDTALLLERQEGKLGFRLCQL